VPRSWGDTMIKAAVTIGSAAILAGLVSILPAPGVEAGTSKAHLGAAVADLPQVPAVRSDAGEARAAGCSQRAWPYYGQDCLTDFDARWGASRARCGSSPPIASTDPLNRPGRARPATSSSLHPAAFLECGLLLPVHMFGQSARDRARAIDSDPGNNVNSRQYRSFWGGPCLPGCAGTRRYWH
jgi:hypothetical protein